MQTRSVWTPKWALAREAATKARRCLLRGSWGATGRRGFVWRRGCCKQVAEAGQKWQNRQKESSAVGPSPGCSPRPCGRQAASLIEPPERSGPVRNETVRRRRAARRFAVAWQTGRAATGAGASSSSSSSERGQGHRFGSRPTRGSSTGPCGRWGLWGLIWLSALGASEKQRTNARSGSSVPSACTQCTCTTKLQVVCCLPVAYLTRHDHRPSGLRLVAEQARASKAEGGREGQGRCRRQRRCRRVSPPRTMQPPGTWPCCGIKPTEIGWMCSIDPATADKRCWRATGDNHREPPRPVPTARCNCDSQQCLLRRGSRVGCGGQQASR